MMSLIDFTPPPPERDEAKIAEVEALLRYAIEERLEEGYALAPYGWSLQANGVWRTDAECKSCAVGLFLIDKERKTSAAADCRSYVDPRLGDAAEYLGITTAEVDLIVIGFDATHASAERCAMAFYQLGHRLRVDYYETGDDTEAGFGVTVIPEST